MKKEITFSKTINFVSDDYFPKPASDILPTWYKKTDSYMGNKKNLDYNANVNATIKKCIPVFDILSAGYIISTYCDLWVKKTDNGQIIYLTSYPDVINFHGTEQAPYHPSMNMHQYPKWLNPWGIKTPAGYSSLFLPPVHGGNGFFTILEGFVDTDTYNAPVNFPFVLNDVKIDYLHIDEGHSFENVK
jgi:hypothetical protein